MNQPSTNPKGKKMKKFAAVLFVFIAVFSNVSFANDKECHPEKEHCEKH